jgi:hypothetical protein
MTRRQLKCFTRISSSDLHYSLIRAITQELFITELILSKIEIEHIGEQYYRITLNNAAKAIFHVQIPITS